MNPDGEYSENIERVPDGPAIQTVTFEAFKKLLKNQKDGIKDMDGKNPPKKTPTFEAVEQRLTHLELRN